MSPDKIQTMKNTIQPTAPQTGPDTFAVAFAKLQGVIRPAIKDATNPAFRSKYADLGAIWEAVRKPLSDHGFGIIQSPQFEGDTMWLETTLLYISGEKMVSRYPLRPVKQDPQGFGSAITYAKRYAISAMLGVVADEDDDGNAASQRSTQATAIHTPHTLPTAQEVTETTPQAWAQKAIDRLATFNSPDEITAFEDKYEAKIVLLAKSLPDMHQKLVAAIADRHSTLDYK
jgi:hypothetical protein